MLVRIFILINLLALALTQAAAQSWSEDLLKEVLQNQEQPLQEKESATPRLQKEQEGLILRSYQPRYLRFSENKRGQSALDLLRRLLPRGATLKLDKSSNTLHLLASTAAQAAANDFLSSLDNPTEEEKVQRAELSPTLQAVLQKLETNEKTNQRLLDELAQVREDLKTQAGEQQKNGANLPYVGLSAAFVLLTGLLVWRTRKNQGKTDSELSLLAEQTKPLASTSGSHTLLNSTPHLTVQQQELHQEMLGVINAAAIRMDAWYQEQKNQREQLTRVVQEQETALRLAQSNFSEARALFLSEQQAVLERVGERFEDTAARLDNKVVELGTQHDRVEAIANELHRTVNELDQTKDDMLRLRSSLEQKNSELDKAREKLSTREAELTKEQAKLAALTLILEESAWNPKEPQASTEETLSRELPERTPFKQSSLAAKEPDTAKLKASEITPNEPNVPATAGNNTAVENQENRCKNPPPNTNFQFLPADFPET